MPKAYVTLSRGAAPDRATALSIFRFLNERLAPFKIPGFLWRAAEPLPRLGTEKVDRRALREKYSRISEGR